MRKLALEFDSSSVKTLILAIVVIDNLNHSRRSQINVISSPMRQLVCFNFHYFIKPVIDCSAAHSIKILCTKICFSLLSYVSRRCFIEPIKAFYLMSAQAGRKEKNERFFSATHSSIIMWITSV